MGLVCPELSLELKPSYNIETINGFVKECSMMDDKSDEVDDDFVKRLESEFKKIEVFKRELPLCMLLLNDAILHLKQETTEYKTRNAHQLVLEEFIPLKKDSSCENNTQMNEEVYGRDMKNWMSSVQLWVDDLPSKQSSASHMSSNQSKDIESVAQKGDEKSNQIVRGDLCNPSKVKAGSIGFEPLVHSYSAGTFPNEKRKTDKEDAIVPGITLFVPGMTTHPEEESISRVSNRKLRGTLSSNSSSPASNRWPLHQQASSRKQRRSWSPELHRRFVDALTQLGGAQVATPKQIRQLMRVDELTNDEVKSHLQKYRLHSRRASNDSGNKNGPRCGSWPPQVHISDSSKPSSAHSQSASPEGSLQFSGLTDGTSTTGGDSMEDDDDGKSENYSWKGHLSRPGKDDV